MSQTTAQTTAEPIRRAALLPVYSRELERVRADVDAPASVHVKIVEKGNTTTRYSKTTATSKATGDLVAVEVTRKEYVFMRPSDAKELQTLLHNAAAPLAAREALAEAVAEAMRLNANGCTRPSIDIRIEEGAEDGTIKGRDRYYARAASTTAPARALQAIAAVAQAAYDEAAERERAERAARDARRAEREATKVARAIDALRNSGLSKEELQALFA